MLRSNTMSGLLSSFYESLNSATQYPSIPTYHVMQNGILQNQVTVDFSQEERVYVSEKIDGTNMRILTNDTDYVIGSRERFIYTQGDRLREQPVVDLLVGLNFWENIMGNPTKIVTVVYGEHFGGKIGKAGRTYGAPQFRIFDMQEIDVHMIKQMSQNDLSRWRETGVHNWLHTDELPETFPDIDGQKFVVPGGWFGRPPHHLRETYEWLQQFATSIVCGGKAEGVVIRNQNRTKIAKLRFEDYERTLRR